MGGNGHSMGGHPGGHPQGGGPGYGGGPQQMSPAMTQPMAIPYALFLAAGPALAVPFAMVTAWPRFGSFTARIGIGRLPEETMRPAELLALALPAIESAMPLHQPRSV